jgi:hypothetical protein
LTVDLNPNMFNLQKEEQNHSKENALVLRPTN